MSRQHVKRQHSSLRQLSLLLALLLLLAGSMPSAVSAAQTPAEKKLTVMIYMCGSNLESDGGAATADITEILRSRYNSDEVNVVAMLGGTRKWWGGMDAQQTAVYEISGNRPRQVWSDGLLNMGDPATLSTLLDYSREQYPARDYALILWNHGGGPMSGVCWDDLSQSDNLTMAELQTALEDSPFAHDPLEWIGFDACLMASVETAHMMAPYAKYMIASQETEPGTGWSYSFLSGIENDADGAATGQRIVESYMEDTPVQDGLTLSCTDLSKIADVEASMDTFFSDLAVELTEDTFSALSNMRQDVQGYGRSEVPSGDLDLVDLADLVDHYAEQSPDHAGALKTAIDEAVLCSQSTIPGSNGLSVYHPYYNKTLYENMAQEEYASFFFSPGYTEYMQRFAALWLGNALTDWSRLAPAAESITEENQAQFTFQLSDEQLANFASAQLLVLEQYSLPDSEGNYTYSQVYVTPEVTLDENGLLTAVYTGRTLYCLDEDGESLTGNLHYSVDGDYIVVPANFINDEEGLLYYTLLYCTVDEETNDLTVNTVYVYDQGSGQFTNRLTVNPEDFSTVYFPLSYYYPTYDGDIFLAYEEWRKNENMVIANGFNDYDGEWHFHFYDEQLTGDQLFATFQVTDTQANTYSTELTQVINPNLEETAVDPSDLSGGNYELKFSAVVRSSELYPGLVLKAELTNPSDRELNYRIRYFKVNRNRAVPASFYETLNAGESGLESIIFSPTDLSGMDSVTSLEGKLEICDPETYDVIEEVPVTLALDADVSAFSAKPDEGHVLAQAEADGMEFQLLSVKEDKAGKLSLELHVTNTSDEPAEFSLAQVAVNGYGIADYSAISLEAGEEVYKTIEYNDDISYYEFFEHTEATDLLPLHDSLSAYGVEQITDISLISDEARVDLILDEPVPYEARPTDEPAGQVLLYEKDDIKVSLGQAFVIDHDVVLALEIRNDGGADADLELLNPEFDGNPAEMNWYGTQTFHARAGITTREYLHMKAQEADDSGMASGETEAGAETLQAQISQVSFLIRSQTEEGTFTFDRICVGFPEAVPFDAEGGVVVNAEDMTVSSEDSFAQDTSGPVVLSEVSLPQDAASFSRELSFSPDETQLEGLTGVNALLVAEYDNSQFLRSEDEPAEGKVISILERTTLDLSEGTASGILQGLYLCAEGAEDDAPYLLTETAPEENGFSFTPVDSISLNAADRFSDLYLMPRLTFSGTADTAQGAASLTQIHIADSANEEEMPDAYTNWPLSCFSSGYVNALALEMLEEESGSWTYSDGWWPFNYDFDLNSPIALELRPAEEFLNRADVQSLGIVYQLFYEDGSYRLTDIEPWE